MINDFISKMKRFFRFGPARNRIYSELIGHSAPSPSTTRWGSWLEAAKKHCLAFPKYSELIEKLENCNTNDSNTFMSLKSMINGSEIDLETGEYVCIEYAIIPQCLSYLNEIADHFLQLINHTQRNEIGIFSIYNKIEKLIETLEITARQYQLIDTNNPVSKKVSELVIKSTEMAIRKLKTYVEHDKQPAMDIIRVVRLLNPSILYVHQEQTSLKDFHVIPKIEKIFTENKLTYAKLSYEFQKYQEYCSNNVFDTFLTDIQVLEF
jgi:hypothetical protein